MRNSPAISALLLALMISIILSSCAPSLSAEELQARAEDYARLVEGLQAVGYDGDFKSLKVKNSLEQNLRDLWTEYLSQHKFAAKDARKNIELLALLKSFDFIAEGLRSKASEDNPYYQDWPRDSWYNASPRTVSFSDDEVLWLMLLLPDSDIPEEYAGLKGVLAECGERVLGQGLLRPSTSEGVWFYYEKTSPGLLEKLDPDFPEYFSDSIKTAFKNADEDIQNRFMRAIDEKNFRDIYYTNSPVRVFSFDEADALIKAYPPTGAWDGGYIRAVDVPARGESLSKRDMGNYNINSSAHGAYIFARESSALVPAINPVDARFAVYETYSDGVHYDTYTGSRDFDLYLLDLNIRIVDLLTGEEILNENVRSRLPPDEITWTSYYGIGGPKIVDGKHFYSDFDWGRYANVMARLCDS